MINSVSRIDNKVNLSEYGLGHILDNTQGKVLVNEDKKMVLLINEYTVTVEWLDLPEESYAHDYRVTAVLDPDAGKIFIADAGEYDCYGEVDVCAVLEIIGGIQYDYGRMD